jgi:hypothetical protein
MTQETLIDCELLLKKSSRKNAVYFSVSARRHHAQMTFQLRWSEIPDSIYCFWGKQ